MTKESAVAGPYHRQVANVEEVKVLEVGKSILQ